MTRAKDIANIISDANFGGTLDVAGETTLATHLNMGDNAKAIFQNNSGDVNIGSQISDKDMKFTGNDGGVAITALTLDMSDGGAATLNNGLTLTDGNLVVASGHGIDFSATGNVSGTSSELLDDYEEGSFTPAPSTGAIANKIGRYIKVGNLVHVTMKLSNFSGGQSSASFQVGGIPFTNNAHESVGSNYVDNVNTGTGFPNITTYVYPNNTIFRLFEQGDDNAHNVMTYNAFDTSSALTVSFTYEIA